MFGSGCSGSTALGHIRYCPGDAFVAKFALAEELADPLWTVAAINTGADSLEDIALGSDRLTLVGTVHESRNDRFRGKSVVEQLSFDGNRLAMTVFSANNGEVDQAQAVAVPSADTVYVAGRAGDYGNSRYIDAYLSSFEPQELFAKPSFFVRSLGDINGDGSQDIVALFSRDGTLTATVKDAEDRHWIRNIKFDSSVAADLEIMADINGNGAPELVVLGASPAQSEIRDSLTGENLGAVDFDPARSPMDLELVKDQTGSGIPELAMLGQSAMQVEVKDPDTNSTVDTLSFNDNYIPRDLAVWPHGGSAAVGVLGESKEPTRGDKVEVRDLDTGKIIKHLWVGKPWDLLQMDLLADLNGNGSPELAVLREHQDDQSVSVLPVDTANGTRFRQLGFDPNYRPVRLRVLDDINGNGSEEIAVLAVRRGCCNQKVWVKDAKTGQSIKMVYFGTQYIGEDMDISPDINGNGAPELVVLGRRDDGVLRAYIKDSKTGEFISSVGF